MAKAYYIPKTKAATIRQNKRIKKKIFSRTLNDKKKDQPTTPLINQSW